MMVHLCAALDESHIPYEIRQVETGFGIMIMKPATRE
jgi:hypothetical protein